MDIAFKEYNLIDDIMSSAYHEAAVKFHISDSELSILYTLAYHGDGCCQSVLYKETWMPKSTVNSALKKMEREGYLYLQPGKGRNTCVFFTEKGGELARNTVYKLVEMENRIYESWTEEERQMFLRLNRDFADKLTRMVKEI